jgi:hypothetical protein
MALKIPITLINTFLYAWTSAKTFLREEMRYRGKRFFGWIFKQILKSNVAAEAETCSVGLFLPRCFRREETFLRGLIGLEVLR